MATTWEQELCYRLATESLRAHPSAELHVRGYDDALRKIQGVVNDTALATEHTATNTRLVVKFRNLRFRPPMLAECDGYAREALPKEFIDLKATYALQAIAEVECYRGQCVADRRTAAQTNTSGMTHVRTWADVQLFVIPCVVGSQYCNTRHALREDQTDLDPLLGGLMGMVILKGTVKHMVLSNRMRVNIPMVRVTEFAEGLPRKVELEYRADQGRMRTTSTLRIYVDGKDNALAPRVQVRIQFIDQPIELGVVFALLDGGNQRTAILRYLLPYGPHEHARLTELVQALAVATLDVSQSQADLLEALGKTQRKGTAAEVREARIENTRKMMMNEFLPHVEHARKAECFGLLARHLLLVYLGLRPEESMHSMVNVRMVTPLKTIGEFFRTLFHSTFCAALKNAMRKCLEEGKDPLTTFPNLIPVNNQLTTRLAGAFSRGDWAAQAETRSSTVSKSGLSQQQISLNRIASIGHMAKMRTPHNPDAKSVEPRQLGSDMIGRTDYPDATEGQTCGLVNANANLNRIRCMYPAEHVRRAILPLAAEYASDDAAATFVLVNGAPVFRTLRPQELCARVRYMRRRTQEIPADVSVAWVGVTRTDPAGEIRICCDAGAILAALFVVDRLPRLQTLLPALRGMAGRQLWDVMLLEGIIEFVDIEEQLCDTTVLTAEFLERAELKRHTWAEIEPSVSLMGPNSVFTPAADRDEAARGSYYANQVRQAIGATTPILNDRFDHRMTLHYPQVCFCVYFFIFIFIFIFFLQKK